MAIWMNEWDINEAANLFETHPVLGPATRTLSNLRDAVNGCSDGWAYWRKPAAAANRLMELIEQGRQWRREEFQHPRTPEPTAEQLRAALRPIKVFRTRHPNCRFKIVESQVAAGGFDGH